MFFHPPLHIVAHCRRYYNSPLYISSRSCFDTLFDYRSMVSSSIFSRPSLISPSPENLRKIILHTAVYTFKTRSPSSCGKRSVSTSIRFFFDVHDVPCSLLISYGKTIYVVFQYCENQLFFATQSLLIFHFSTKKKQNRLCQYGCGIRAIRYFHTQILHFFSIFRLV